MPAKAPSGATLFSLSNSDAPLSFFRPADAEALLEAITDRDFSRDEYLPYWAEHWPAADVLVARLLQHPLPVNLTVCEIGCGLGVVSSVLAREQRLVVSTDISADACRYTRANIELHGGVSRTVCADWRRPCFRPFCDCLLASDILYEKRWIQPALAFALSVIKKDGLALIADPKRGHWPAFLRAAQSSGLSVEIVHTATVNDNKTCVEIARLSGFPGS